MANERVAAKRELRPRFRTSSAWDKEIKSSYALARCSRFTVSSSGGLTSNGSRDSLGQKTVTVALHDGNLNGTLVREFGWITRRIRMPDSKGHQASESTAGLG